MDWLSSWLKSIILVILLATFIDLLLPNQTMQRYVKTVMSLFILLTLLHPVFALFQKHTQVDEMLAGALLEQKGVNGGQLKLSAGSVPVNGSVEPLGSIQQQAQTLREKQEQQAHRLVQQQAADLMKRSIEQSAGVKVALVQVETTTDAKGSKLIKNVKVSLHPEVKPLEKEKKGSPVVRNEPIRAVEPVRIQVESHSSAVTKPQDQAATVSAPELEQKRTQVVHLLRQDWQLQDHQVSVNWLETKPKY